MEKVPEEKGYWAYRNRHNIDVDKSVWINKKINEMVNSIILSKKDLQFEFILVRGCDVMIPKGHIKIFGHPIDRLFWKNGIYLMAEGDLLTRVFFKLEKDDIIN